MTKTVLELKKCHGMYNPALQLKVLSYSSNPGDMGVLKTGTYVQSDRIDEFFKYKDSFGQRGNVWYTFESRSDVDIYSISPVKGSQPYQSAILFYHKPSEMVEKYGEAEPAQLQTILVSATLADLIVYEHIEY